MYVSRRIRLLWKYLLSNLEYRKRSSRATEKASTGACRRISFGLGVLATAIVASRATGLADDYFPIAALGVSVMVAAFLLQFLWPRRLYVLVLRTSSGDVDALISRKEQLVSNVRQALEQAFMIRAGQPALSAELGSETAIRQALDVAARAARATMPRHL